jgi:hypothetical protein
VCLKILQNVSLDGFSSSEVMMKATHLRSALDTIVHIWCTVLVLVEGN